MGRSLAELIADVRRGISSPAATAQTKSVQESSQDHREPTDEERELIRWLIVHGSNSSELLSQVDGLRVRPSCTCGCPSIELLAASSQHAEAHPERIVADYVGRVDGRLVGLMLRAAGDRLTDLEVYDLEGLDHPFGLPAIETLEPFLPPDS